MITFDGKRIQFDLSSLRALSSVAEDRFLEFAVIYEPQLRVPRSRGLKRGLLRMVLSRMISHILLSKVGVSSFKE